MKGIKLTELLAEIKANLVAFISIAMFVCLGIGLFLGIQWGGEAIGNVAEKTFEGGRLHDIEVQFPYGLTKDDLAKLAAIEGVTDVEPGYASYASVLDGPASYVFKVQSLTKRIDQPQVVEGKLPAKANEVAMLSFWAEEHDCQVGDTITFVPDADDDEDKDGMAQLATGKVTITGLVEHPAYLSKVVGSLGSAAIGAGRVDCVVFAPEAAFDTESYDGCYPNAYLRCDGLREHSTFSDEYKAGLATILESVNELGGELGDARYNDVRTKTSDKIADAEREISDADDKLTEAEGKIADGEKEIADGERELADGEQAIKDGEKEIADAEREIANGEQALAEGKQQIDDSAEELADGEQQLDEAHKKLVKGEKEYTSGQASLNEEQSKAKSKLNAAKEELDSAQATYDENKEQFDSAKSDYEDASKAYNDHKEDYEKSLVDIEKLRGETQVLDEKTEAYDQALADYRGLGGSGEVADAAADVSAKEAALAEAQEAVENAQAAYDEAKEAAEANPDDAEAQAAAEDAKGALEEAKKQEALAQDAKDAADAAYADAKDRAWAGVQSAYDELKPAYESMRATHNELLDLLQSVGDSYDLGELVEDADRIGDLSPLSEDNPEAPSIEAHNASASAQALLEAIDLIEVEQNGKTYHYVDLPDALADSKEALDKAETELASAKKELDKGWKDYNTAKDEYDKQVASGKTKLADGRTTLDDGWSEYQQGKTNLGKARGELAKARATYRAKLQELEDGKRELANGRQRLTDSKRELEEGREKLANSKRELEDARQQVIDKREELLRAMDELKGAKEKLNDMEAYEWIVLARPENGGVNSLDTIKVMMGNVRWAMALLFVLVGLFVCYSAVARLVNDEVVQIGTKKAVGFREREVATEYLSFSGIAVLAGVLLSILVAVVAVQGIMNPASAASFTLPSFPPYFSLTDLLMGGGIELVLILLSTWFAIHGLLKKNAIVLLNGGETKVAKQRFYEKWGAWNRLPLFTQTIINNCVNDTRRVAATLVGVVGCTALIVTAVTLWNNVSRGFERHYNEIYGFDTIVYLDDDVEGAATTVGKALDGLGLPSEQAHLEVMQVRQTDGYRNTVNLFVPTSSAFEDYYQVLAVDGEGDPAKADGVLISQAYADHMGVGVGDEVKVTENNGRVHTLKVAGVFEYYLLRNEFVLGAEQYRKEFGGEPVANVLLAGAGDTDLDPVRSSLRGVEGYDTLVDDYADSYYSFHELSSLLETVVAVYLLLSALMALVVLLNLDIMFVDEKKRELIVLMICGFSTKDAKAYIYRDSLVLTAIGIIAGVALGAVLGNVTVRALEPTFGSFLKGFNWLAAAVGVVGAGTFSVAVLLFALRKIPRFDLTDINRF